MASATLFLKDIRMNQLIPSANEGNILIAPNGQKIDLSQFASVPSKITRKKNRFMPNKADADMKREFFEATYVKGLDNLGQLETATENYVKIWPDEWTVFAAKVQENTDAFFEFAGRFPDDWDHYLKVKGNKVGTPISSITNNPAMITMLQAIQIFTVEKLVATADSDLRIVKGGVEFKKKAELFLDQGLALRKAKAEKDSTTEELERAKARIAEFEAIIAKKVKVEVADEQDDSGDTSSDSGDNVVRETKRSGRQSK